MRAAALSLSLLAAVAVTPAFLLPTAQAHAQLEEMQPAPDALVQRSPQQVMLRFDSTLEPAFSNVRVLDAGGQRVDDGDASVAADDRHILRVSLPGLPSGVYTVLWRAVCRDSHPSQGRFVFAVK